MAQSSYGLGEQVGRIRWSTVLLSLHSTIAVKQKTSLSISSEIERLKKSNQIKEEKKNEGHERE